VGKEGLEDLDVEMRLISQEGEEMRDLFDH